jgi:hypothetical protein
VIPSRRIGIITHGTTTESAELGPRPERFLAARVPPSHEVKGYRDILARFRELRRQFQHVHRDGMDALAHSDYKRLGDAIRREGEILKQQRSLIASIGDKKKHG